MTVEFFLLNKKQNISVSRADVHAPPHPAPHESSTLALFNYSITYSITLLSLVSLYRWLRGRRTGVVSHTLGQKEALDR